MQTTYMIRIDTKFRIEYYIYGSKLFLDTNLSFTNKHDINFFAFSVSGVRCDTLRQKTCFILPGLPFRAHPTRTFVVVFSTTSHTNFCCCFFYHMDFMCRCGRTFQKQNKKKPSHTKTKFDHMSFYACSFYMW